jgi:hypothetical protein
MGVRLISMTKEGRDRWIIFSNLRIVGSGCCKAHFPMFASLKARLV